MNNDRMNGRREKHEDAVSPVIGVMLMLVVTIIIAAVISGFAGELVGTTEKAPRNW
ncbi:type IV pilin N-terminal domain-containing protein [Methanoculleus chikugoensis]|uniref:type IV pilin N-terminal domain-containing protein n=1 Tax=Methanoculleus chikugoensis TaxID=118126 RepID=UPI000AFAC02B|nr:type IV pilin N-terminal domain-containing protein [Methanoculleus chikugoensis]